VTITSSGRVPLFGIATDGHISLSWKGETVRHLWLSLRERFAGVGLDEFVIMPDHFHAILMLGQAADEGVGPPCTVPVDTAGAGQARQLPRNTVDSTDPVAEGLAPPHATSTNPPTLSTVIGAFKSLSTIAANKFAHTPGSKLWQRGFYERVIRNEAELDKFRRYIVNNPQALAFREFEKG